ncbi:hypothetical protein, partial [Vibrio sp. AND4]|uniref:hypothetical protein n=1 Tax=Vibrio sp. AND4 TaxID=314289 RepID=UPI0019D35BBC
WIILVFKFDTQTPYTSNTQKRPAIYWIAGRFSLLLFIQNRLITTQFEGIKGCFATVRVYLG